MARSSTGRHPGWETRQNPQHPPGTKLKRSGVACHDGSAFQTLVMACGHSMHLHETQIEHVPAGTIIDSACPTCRMPVEVEVDYVRRLIEAGWE